jgi:replication factor C subunit 3/5
MFFVDKYYPKNINESFFHLDLLKRLEHMAKDESIPHIIFHGVSGSGKKTIINLFLKMLYGKEVGKLISSTYMVSGSGNSVIPVEVKKSNYHIIIVPNNNNFDRYLVQDVVKEYVKKMPLNIFNIKRTFKTVLIQNIDNMSYYAQTSLRRTMEKYSSCRFIMWSRSLSKVIDPLRSRCLCIRVNRPPYKLLFKKIFDISLLEKIKMNYRLINNIISKSDGNIKKIYWFLELIKNKQYLKINNNIIKTFYDEEKKIVYKLKKEENIYSILKLENNYFLNGTVPVVELDFKNENLKKINIDDIKEKFNNKKIKLLSLDEDNIKYLDNNYDLILNQIINLILTCDIDVIYQIRNLLYNIMITNINGTNIIKDITSLLLKNERIPDICFYSIIKYACIYDHSIVRSRREIIHLDGFIIKVMSILYDNTDYDPFQKSIKN